jgi:hypothetical protein
MELWLSRSLSHKHFSFFTMKFWLSRSLFHELFSRWNSGYHEALFKNFFHDGILAITEPFSWTFFFFHDGILAITKPFSRTFFTMEFWLSRSLFHELFSRWNSGNTQFGGRPFSYIYHKEYLRRIHFVKNLAYWFRAPFARKRVRSFLF